MDVFDLDAGEAVDEFAKSTGFTRGLGGGFHKYKRRVHQLVGGHLKWVYYYDDPKVQAQHKAAPVVPTGHGGTVETSPEDHRAIGEFSKDNPTQVDSRTPLQDLTVESVVTAGLPWEKQPEVRVLSGDLERYHGSLVRDPEYAEPEDPVGSVMSPLRALEMGLSRVPKDLLKAFDGAVSQLILSTPASTPADWTGKLKLASGWCQTGDGYKGGSQLALQLDLLHVGWSDFAGMHGGLIGPEVVIHELGHAIHGRLTGYDSPTKVKRTWNGKSWTDWEEFVKKAKEKGVTKYAQKNKQERFAESFSAALMFPRQLATIAPKTYNWFREFLGAENMRPLHSNPELLAQLQEKRRAAVGSGDIAAITAVDAEIDINTGVLDMAADDPRLAWWLSKRSRVQQFLQNAQAPSFATAYKLNPPDMARIGNQGEDHDRFFEISNGRRTVYMRVGPSGDRGATYSGWDPADPEKAQIKPGASEIKELYTEDGTPLTNRSAWWWLHQDELPDDHPAAQKLVGFDVTAKDNPEAHKEIRRLQLHEQLVQWSRNAHKGDEEAAKKNAVEITGQNFKLRSGAFAYDSITMAGHEEYTALKSEKDPAKRDALLAAFVKKQPWVQRVQNRDPKTGKFTKGYSVVMAAGPDGLPVPVMNTIRYENANPDGTITRVEVTRDTSGDPSRSGRYYIQSSMWRELLTPQGEDVRSAEHLQQLMRDAAQRGAQTWMSVRTDSGGSVPHHYHLQVQFDGRGQPKVLGSAAKIQTGKTFPRLDDYLVGTGDGKRPKIPAPAIHLPPPDVASGARVTTPEVGRDYVVDVTAGEVSTNRDKAVVMKLQSVLEGKRAGDPPPPPTYERMRNAEEDPITELPLAEGEAPRRLTPRERRLIKVGAVPATYLGTAAQRTWLKDQVEPKLAEALAHQEEWKAQEWPDRFVFVGTANGGAAGRRVVRSAEAIKDTVRNPYRSTAPEPLDHTALMYMHEVIDPRSGEVKTVEPRLLLPKDGSIPSSSIEAVEGVSVGEDENGGTAITLALDQFARVREVLGGLSITGDADAYLKTRVAALREAEVKASQGEHVMQLEEIDPVALAAQGVGLKPIVFGGVRFELAEHQQGAIQKLMDNEGRGLLWHYMGCVSGSTQVHVNRGGKGFTTDIATLVQRQNGGGHYAWDPEIPTRVRTMLVDGTTGLVVLDRAWDSGVKTTYRMTLEDGRSIRTTDEHRFWTSEGWRRHDTVAVGDLVAVQLPAQSSGGRTKILYAYRTGLRFHPYAGCRGARFAPFRVVTHRLVVEAAANGLELEAYLSRLRHGDVAGLTFLAPEQVVHHRDGDPTNNAIANLEVLESQAEHAQQHDNRSNFGDNLLGWMAVVEVMADPYVEPTYDLTMPADTPSYLANGMVVHNTGKTITTVAADKIMQARKNPDGTPHKLSEGKTLIVAPLNTVGQWIDAYGDFDEGATRIGAGATDIPVSEYLKMVEEGRDTNATAVVGPEYWALNAEALKKAGFKRLFVDEAHMGLKNDTSLRNQVLKEWNPDMNSVVLMTGTPATTSPADLQQYIEILSQGSQLSGMSRSEFVDTYLEESPVPSALGVGAKGPKVHVKPSKRNELSAIIGGWTHVASPRDVKGKLLPAVRIEENKHAHMTGTQAKLYGFYMGAVSAADRERMKANAETSADETAGLSEDVRESVATAKAIANCAAYKPASSEPYLRIVREAPSVGEGDSVTKIKEDFKTMDPEQLMSATRGKYAGTWPAMEALTQEEVGIYELEFAGLLGTSNYGAIAGSKITPAQLQRMKDDGWPRKVRNPDAGPVGIKCRGSDVPIPPPENLQVALEFQARYSSWLGRKLKIPGQKTLPIDSMEALVRAMDEMGLQGGAEDAAKLLNVHPEPTEHRPFVEYGGIHVPEGKSWVSDKRGSLHLLFRQEDWDEASGKPRSAGGFEAVKDGAYVAVKNNAGIKPPTGLSKEERAAWDPPALKYDASLGEQGGKVAIRRMDTDEVIWTPKAAVSAIARSLMDPGMRAERAQADVAMVVGNAKAEEFQAHVGRFHDTTGPGPDGARQIVAFANGILDGCRTMEASLRLMGFQDVNEAIEGSPHYDPTDPRAKTGAPNGRYFVTYIGSTYTGDRELNAEIFKKRKDKLGRDSDVSLFVSKVESGRAWKAYAGDTDDHGIRMAQYDVGIRDRIKKAFGINAPEAQWTDTTSGKEAVVKYFYGTPRSREILRQIVLVGDPTSMTPERAVEAKAQIAELKAEYAGIVRKLSTTRPPLTERQRTVFNNCDAIVCSDAAQVGLNFGNSVEMVMYDSLGSPQAEWQRITRSARMLPPAVAEKLWGKPVPGRDGKLQMDARGRVVTDGTGPFTKIRDAEPELFRAAERGMPDGLVYGLQFGKDDRPTPECSVVEALKRVETMALIQAGRDPATEVAWEAIAAKARVASTLGTSQAIALLEELKATRAPGSNANVLDYRSYTVPDVNAGTYDEPVTDEVVHRVREALDALPEADRAVILSAGYVDAEGGLDASAVYLAMRTDEIMAWVEEERPRVEAQMRTTAAGAVVQESDVMNRVIDALTPADRAILKSRKTLVNVRRIGVSATVPLMKTIDRVVTDDAGKTKTEKVDVFSGYTREHPITPEVNVRATGRARMVSTETLMNQIRRGVSFRSEVEYASVNAGEMASASLDAPTLEKNATWRMGLDRETGRLVWGTLRRVSQHPGGAV